MQILMFHNRRAYYLSENMIILFYVNGHFVWYH